MKVEEEEEEEEEEGKIFHMIIKYADISKHFLVFKTHLFQIKCLLL